MLPTGDSVTDGLKLHQAKALQLPVACMEKLAW